MHRIRAPFGAPVTSRWWGAAILALALVAAAGCSSDEPAAGEPPARAASPVGDSAPVDPADCRERGPATAEPLQEVEGDAVDAILWALPFAARPFGAGQEVKVVWRMTGKGPPRFEVTGPGGPDPGALRWGPEEHTGSSWKRPGDEWGTGLRFDEPGCWRVTVRRDVGTGSVWFTVSTGT